MAMQLVPLELIDDNPYQPRVTDDPEHIEKLARSIGADDLLQMPKARSAHAGRFQLAFGHSRRKAFEWLAAHYEENGLPERYGQYLNMPLDVEDYTEEEMYRFAVTENVQRKDLAPTELARSMKRYMDEFGKNSTEVAALFGMNDSTVRGMVRLLDLPALAQQKLDDGTISQGVARTLLSIQKIAPEKVIVDAVEQIEKGVDRWGDKTTPEEIIDNVVDNIENAELLWNDRWDGKPRAGHRSSGWLLTMKNFPNHYLPLLTGHVAVQALGCFDDKPAQKLVLEWAEYEAANQVTQMADGSKIDPDDEYYESNRKQQAKRIEELEKINPDYVAKLLHLVRPTACSACPFYTKIDGAHYCGMKQCLERRSQAWAREQMRAASKDMGIEIYDAKNDGEFVVLEDTYDNRDHQKLFVDRNKDLRLAMAVDINRKKTQYGYNGVPDGACVILVGKTMKKLDEQKKKARQEKRTTVDLDALRDEMKDEKQDLLKWEATLYIKSIFDAFTLNAMEMLSGAPYGWAQYSVLKDNEPSRDDVEKYADWMRRKLAFYMLCEAQTETDWEDEESLAALAEFFTAAAKRWDVKLPKAVLKVAEQFDAEIAAVSAETPIKKSKK